VADKKEKGDRGEKLATEFLKKRGYAILAQNYRYSRCEADIVARDESALVFVEVKARSGELYGSGRESVDSRKQAHIVKAALGYMLTHNAMETTIRFDVIEVELRCGEVTHIIDAFRV